MWYTVNEDAKAKSPETTSAKTSKIARAEAMKQAETVLEEARISTLPDPNSLEHLMTHLPKHPDCRACQIAKMKSSHCRRVPHEHKEKVTKFGQEVTADTLVAKNAVSKSYDGSKYAIVWYDEGTG